MPGQASPFSQDQRIWIVEKFGHLKSATLVRRAFRIEFKVSSPSNLPHRKQFSRVIEKFEACGHVGSPECKRKPSDMVPQNDVKAVQDFFSRNEEEHTREAVKELGF